MCDKLVLGLLQARAVAKREASAQVAHFFLAPMTQSSSYSSHWSNSSRGNGSRLCAHIARKEGVSTPPPTQSGPVGGGGWRQAHVLLPFVYPSTILVLLEVLDLVCLLHTSRAK